MALSDSEEFRRKRELWLKCFSGKDPHSIMWQITGMLTNAAIFRVIHEGWRIAPVTDGEGSQVNRMMSDLIIYGFLTGQMFAVRRLTDPEKLESDSHKRDVCSLISLLDDMQAHACLMTRKNIFKAEKLEYNVARIICQVDEYRLQQRKKGVRAGGDPHGLDPARSEERHKQIDILAGVKSGKRSPDDRVDPNVMEYLKAKIKAACPKLDVYINKFLAHAATPKSREIEGADDIDMPLKKLQKAQKTICKVVHFVGKFLLSESIPNPVGAAQSENFKYIERPLVAKKDIQKVMNIWNDYDKETSKWAKWGLEDFQRELDLKQRGERLS